MRNWGGGEGGKHGDVGCLAWSFKLCVDRVGCGRVGWWEVGAAGGGGLEARRYDRSGVTQRTSINRPTRIE